MTNEELIDKIKAEIERQEKQCPLDTYEGRHKLFILGGLKTFIATLESEKPVPAGLEEAAKKFAVFYDQGTCDGIAQDCFIAGAKWQAEKDARDMYMSDNRHFEKVYQLGKKDMKEQMMKEAVDTVVSLDAGGFPFIEFGVGKFGLKVGDKVRVIIVKEDKK